MGEAFVLDKCKWIAGGDPVGDEMKKYQIIYADPPWSYRDKGCSGNTMIAFTGLVVTPRWLLITKCLETIGSNSAPSAGGK